MKHQKKALPKRAKFAIIDTVQYNWNLDVVSLEDTLPLLMEAASKGLDQKGIVSYVNGKIPNALVIAGAGRGKTAVPLETRIAWTEEYLELLKRLANNDSSAKAELTDKFARVIIMANGTVAEDTFASLVTRYDKPFAVRLESARIRKAAKEESKANESVD